MSTIVPKKIKDLVTYLRGQGDTDELKKLIEYLLPFDQEGEVSDPYLINIIQKTEKYNDSNKKQITEAIDKLDYLSKREATEVNAWIKEHEEDIKSGNITKLKRSYTKPGKPARPKPQVGGREFELSHSIVFRVEGGVIKPIALSHKKLGAGALGQVKEAQFVNLKDRKKPTEKFVSKVQNLTPFRKEKVIRREARGQKKVKAIIGPTKPIIRPGEGQGFVVDKAYIFIPKEGLSLDKYIKGNPGLSSLDRLKIAISAFEDLKTRFHDQDIIHRDIKIENMTIDPSSMQVKNIDLGTFIDMKRAKGFEDVTSPHQFVNKMTSREIAGNYQRIAKRVFEKDKVEYYVPSKAWAESVGTAKAMSPEIAVPMRDTEGNIIFEEGRALFQPKEKLMYSKKSDMYAMGVVLEELSLKGVKEVDVLIQKLKDPDPSKRPSVEEALKELQKIQLKLEGKPVVDETVSPAKAPAPTASKPPAKSSAPKEFQGAFAKINAWIKGKRESKLETRADKEKILKEMEDYYKGIEDGIKSGTILNYKLVITEMNMITEGAGQSIDSAYQIFNQEREKEKKLKPSSPPPPAKSSSAPQNKIEDVKKAYYIFESWRGSLNLKSKDANFSEIEKIQFHYSSMRQKIERKEAGEQEIQQFLTEIQQFLGKTSDEAIALYNSFRGLTAPPEEDPAIKTFYSWIMKLTVTRENVQYTKELSRAYTVYDRLMQRAKSESEKQNIREQISDIMSSPVEIAAQKFKKYEELGPQAKVIKQPPPHVPAKKIAPKVPPNAKDAISAYNDFIGWMIQKNKEMHDKNDARITEKWKNLQEIKVFYMNLKYTKDKDLQGKIIKELAEIQSIPNEDDAYKKFKQFEANYPKPVYTPQPPQSPAPQSGQTSTAPSGPGKGGVETQTPPADLSKVKIKELKDFCDRHKWTLHDPVPSKPNVRTIETHDAHQTTLQVTPNEVRFNKSAPDYKAFAEVLVKMHGNAQYALFHADSTQLELMRKACAEVLAREHHKTPEEAMQQIKGYGEEEAYKAALQGKPAPEESSRPDVKPRQ